jgi:hypothetical protein
LGKLLETIEKNGELNRKCFFNKLKYSFEKVKEQWLHANDLDWKQDIEKKLVLDRNRGCFLN